MTLPVVVIGLSHKTAPVDVRERFASGSEVLPEVLARLTRRPELEEAMFLSTCNRVEVLALPKPHATLEESIQAASHAIRESLREHIGASSVDDLREYLYERSGEEAVRHVFRVAASLDSMVLGEPQILGQVKDAYDAAIAAGAIRSHLARCVSRSFTVAKRIRTETQLGAGTVSISSVAVDLAKRIFGELNEHTVLLVGAGEMAEQAAKSLGQQAKAIRICNRSFERAAILASHFNAAAAPLEQLEAELVQSDVVVASTSSKSFVVTKDLVKRVMKQRKGKTLFFIDIAVPRNIEPAVHGLDNVYVYNVDDLEHEVAENMKSRQKEVAAAEKIVEAELGSWTQWARGLNVNPTIVALRAKTKGVLLAELERTLGTRLKHLPEGDRQALTQMVESATNKLLHSPTTRLKEAAGVSDGNDLVRAAQHLFDLPAAPPPEPSSPSVAPPRVTDDETEKRLSHYRARLLAPMPTLVYATRRSALALAQCRAFVARLKNAHPDLEMIEEQVVTTGDKIQDRPLSEVGGKGLFVKEIEEALLERRAHIAVHSIKDVPAVLPDGLAITCIPLREDPRDVIVSPKYGTLAALPKGAKLGTSSLRREAAIRTIRPDLDIQSIRGNVDTRLRKVDEGEFDAIVLARAGLVRLGLETRATEVLEPEVSLPAVGQGALGIESRLDDEDTRIRLSALADETTSRCVHAERGVLKALGADCKTPLAAFAQREGKNLVLRAFVVTPEKTTKREVTTEPWPGTDDEAERIGRALGAKLL